MKIEFTPENKKRFDEILTRYPNKQAPLLPVLWLAQEQFGFLSDETIKYVAGLLDLSPVHVLSVVTFYTMYRRKPVGRHHIQMCRTLSCALAGSANIAEHIQTKLGIGKSEVTKDGKFSFCEVECLGSCGTAPAMMINEKYYENLSPKKVDEILKNLK